MNKDAQLSSDPRSPMLTGKLSEIVAAGTLPEKYRSNTAEEAM